MRFNAAIEVYFPPKPAAFARGDLSPNFIRAMIGSCASFASITDQTTNFTDMLLPTVRRNVSRALHRLPGALVRSKPASQSPNITRNPHSDIGTSRNPCTTISRMTRMGLQLAFKPHSRRLPKSAIQLILRHREDQHPLSQHYLRRSVLTLGLKPTKERLTHLPHHHSQHLP